MTSFAQKNHLEQKDFAECSQVTNSKRILVFLNAESLDEKKRIAEATFSLKHYLNPPCA